MTVVAFDTKEFNRGLDKTFFACLGVGVEIKNEQNFGKEYISSFEKISKDFGFNKTRKIYKAYDMGQRLGFRKAIAFWEKLLEEVQDFIVRLNVYYTILPPSKIKKVKMYGAQKSKVKEVDALDFLGRLNPAYVHCCAWKYMEDNVSLPQSMLLDYFEYEVTEGWNALIERVKPKIYYHGDKCNPFISLADNLAMLVDVRLYRFYKNKLREFYEDNLAMPVDDRLYRKKIGLSGENIVKAFEDIDVNVLASPIDLRHLKYVSPYRNQKIDTVPYIARPLIIVIPEEIKLASGRRIIEDSPLMDAILDKAVDMDGSVKFFDPNIDAKVVKKGDIAVYIGPESEKTALLLKRTHDIEVMSEKDF